MIDKYCGECGKKLTKKTMWSEYTCLECALELGLTTKEDLKIERECM